MQFVRRNCNYYTVEIKIRFDWKNFSGKKNTYNTFHSKNYALVYAPLPIFDRENVYFFFHLEVNRAANELSNASITMLLDKNIKTKKKKEEEYDWWSSSLCLGKQYRDYLE